MQTENQLKDFTCQLHHSETIQRVCIDSIDDSALKCIQCLLEKASKSSMITLDEFLENAARQYQTFRKTSFVFENGPPNELIGFLAQEEENIENFSQHIEQEKQRVNNALDTMIQEFTQLCIRKRNEIALQLDKQLVTFKFNYTYYKSNLDKYYNKENSLNPDKETLLDRINQCKDTNEAEVLVKNIKDDLSMASSNGNLRQIKESFNSIAQILQEQANLLPKIPIDTFLNDFKKAVDSLMEGLVEPDNKISQLSLTNFINIDSMLIKKSEDFNLLKEWLALSHKDFKLKLLYRGSRDGFSFQAFHEKCDNHAPTLTIAKSHCAKVFGGYTDKTWNYDGQYKKSENSWLFSIDEKLKFPLLNGGSHYAIKSEFNHGPIFGSGPDFSVTFCQEYCEGFSYLGQTYQMPKQPIKIKKNPGNMFGLELSQTILAGCDGFEVQELEIYAVEEKI